MEGAAFKSIRPAYLGFDVVVTSVQKCYFSLNLYSYTLKAIQKYPLNEKLNNDLKQEEWNYVENSLLYAWPKGMFKQLWIIKIF